RLVGIESLPEEEKLILETARLIREGFLQQNAYDPIDTYSSPEKQFKLLDAILKFHELALKSISKGLTVSKIISIPSISDLAKARMNIPNEKIDEIDTIIERIDSELRNLEGGI
ncbi:MAG: hypothetical protein QXG78_04595, partial [Candidatus Methanomethyliaceae archaeon]